MLTSKIYGPSNFTIRHKNCIFTRVKRDFLRFKQLQLYFRYSIYQSLQNIYVFFIREVISSERIYMYILKRLLYYEEGVRRLECIDSGIRRLRGWYVYSV